VQCKNLKKAVGNRPVQEVYAGAKHHRCVGACVVAPAGYTRGAIELARSTSVSLYDRDAVRRWIGRVDRPERERARTDGASQQTEHPGGRPTPVEGAAEEEARKRAIYHPHPDDPPRD
jgi:hypothetical protein